MPWQKELMTKLFTYRPKELTVIAAGRNLGKSMYSQHWDSVFQNYMSNLKFKIITKATVDGELWYTVNCTKEVSAWVREQPTNLWHEHIDDKWVITMNQFDMNEKLYTQLALKWS